MTNKNKQNIRYKKVCEKQNKRKSYKGLTEDEKKYIKIKEKYDLIDKDYNDFYKTAPRNSNGAVDWKKLSEKELDIFDYLYKQHEKLLKKLSDLEDKIDVDNALNIFLQVNTHSQSF